MARYNQNFNANAANTQLFMVQRGQQSASYEATIMVSGTFGGGTVTFFVTPDGGTTFIPLKDTSGNVISSTTTTMYNIRLGNGNKANDAPWVYATVAGATNPVINITVFDNR